MELIPPHMLEEERRKKWVEEEKKKEEYSKLINEILGTQINFAMLKLEELEKLYNVIRGRKKEG
jgi:hypothetical protein